MNSTAHALTVAATPRQFRQHLPRMVGDSAAMRCLAHTVKRAAPTSLPILLRGDTGSGKELVAAAIHRLSLRADRPFVALNAATVTSELGASQLFGHTTGAFTGASVARNGAFRQAHGGTLFLDELASLPLDSQAKLLRALEEGCVTPVGHDRPTPIDVRIISATCEPLEKHVLAGTFRADLFQRLSVIVIETPALHERREDIPDLAQALLAASELAGPKLSESALAELALGTYEGNVRELRNVVLRAALLCDGPQIEAVHVRAVLESRASTRTAPNQHAPTQDQAEELLRVSGGNVSLAARRANLARSTYRDLLHRGRASFLTVAPE